jgi:hypothetical protein
LSSMLQRSRILSSQFPCSPIIQRDAGVKQG